MNLYDFRAIDMAFKRMYEFDLFFFSIATKIHAFHLFAWQNDGTIFSICSWQALQMTSLFYRLFYLLFSSSCKNAVRNAQQKPFFLGGRLNSVSEWVFGFFYSPHPSTLSLCYEMRSEGRHWNATKKLEPNAYIRIRFFYCRKPYIQMGCAMEKANTTVTQ